MTLNGVQETRAQIRLTNSTLPPREGRSCKPVMLLNSGSCSREEQEQNQAVPSHSYFCFFPSFLAEPASLWIDTYFSSERLMYLIGTWLDLRVLKVTLRLGSDFCPSVFIYYVRLKQPEPSGWVGWFTFILYLTAL